MHTEIREADGKFHVYVRGYYHCTCVNRADAEFIVASRFAVVA